MSQNCYNSSLVITLVKSTQIESWRRRLLFISTVPPYPSVMPITLSLISKYNTSHIKYTFHHNGCIIFLKYRYESTNIYIVLLSELEERWWLSHGVQNQHWHESRVCVWLSPIVNHDIVHRVWVFTSVVGRARLLSRGSRFDIILLSTFVGFYSKFPSYRARISSYNAFFSFLPIISSFFFNALSSVSPDFLKKFGIRKTMTIVL